MSLSEYRNYYNSLDKYKKAEIPKLIEAKMKSLNGETVQVSADDIEFDEVGQLDNTPMVVE